MTYSLEFHEKALKEFRALDVEVRERFKRKLAERLIAPHIEADRLSGSPNRYKIKFKHPGVRLVYEVVDAQLIVFVLAVDKRERSAVYTKAAVRFFTRKR